jgi:predicted lipid carrier protein YhbT
MTELFDATWFADLRARLAAIEPLGNESVRLALGQVVHDAPSGPVAWTVHVGGGDQARVEDGVANAQVTLIEDYETAVALASGTPTTELLYNGKVKISGDVEALLRGTELLSQLNAALGEG